MKFYKGLSVFVLALASVFASASDSWAAAAGPGGYSVSGNPGTTGGPTGTMGVGTPSGNGQMTLSTGTPGMPADTYTLIYDPTSGEYILRRGGQNWGEVVFSANVPPPGYSWTASDNNGQPIASGQATPLQVAVC